MIATFLIIAAAYIAFSFISHAASYCDRYVPTVPKAQPKPELNNEIFPNIGEGEDTSTYLLAHLFYTHAFSLS